MKAGTRKCEELTKALHSAQFATQELQAALKTADAVAALVLLPMIGDAARLVAQITRLIHATAEYQGDADADRDERRYAEPML